MKNFCLRTLLFSSALLLFGCQDDNLVEEAKQDHFEISIERKSFNEFHDLPALVSKHTAGDMPGNLARGTTTDPLYDFEIDSTSVTQIVREGKTYYTMAIYRPEAIGNSFENLVISNNGPEGEAHIVKYFPSQEYLQSLETNTHAPFIGEINITTLDYSQLMGRGVMSCYTVTMVYCGNGPAGTLAGPGCYKHSDGGAHVYTRSYTVCKELPADNTYISPDVPQSGGGSGSASPSTPIVTEPVLLFAEFQFVNGLSAEQKAWWNDPVNLDEKQGLINYIQGNNSSAESKLFAKEIIDVLNTLEVESEAEKLAVTKVLIYSQQNNYFNRNLDTTFYTTIASYSSLDTTDPFLMMKFSKLFLAHCAVLKQENPNWSTYDILSRAYLDTTHLIGDLAGLVPVVGEVADLANGTIYLIEGDKFNAVLSYASAIPFAGWFSAGVKFAKRADGLKFLVVGTDNLITFGKESSKKFRAVCGIAVGDVAKQAHHIIPRGSQIIKHPVVQRAAQATTNQGFHIDQALNGIAVATWRNQPNHPNYNNRIYTKLQNYIQQNPNASPVQCYNQLMIVLNQAKQAIINNPNTHLNDLVF